MEAITPQVLDSREVQARDMFDIQGLEETARSGIETHKGVRELEFRVGVEMEFCILQDPAKVRQVLDEDKFFARPQTRSSFVRDLLNPACLESETQDHTDLFSDFQSYAKGFIRSMTPKDDTETETKKRWLKEIAEFKPRDMLHFLLYEEFSQPSLGVPVLNENASLGEVDDFTENNGWLEWRFGTGNLQSGYYDNDGVSEIRMNPCSPTEAVRRSRIIRQRIAELGDDFGFVVKGGGASSVGLTGEHINLSVYDANDNEGSSLVGNGQNVADDTIDITSGIMAGFQDRIWVDPHNLTGYDYVFSKHSSKSMEVAPTRKCLRVLANRLELRSNFYSTEHGLAWMMAGAVDGLRVGSNSLAEQGYEVSSLSEVHRTVRSGTFVKDTDLQVQRAFEGSTMDHSGRFELGVGYEMIRGDRLADELFVDTDVDRIDVSLIIASARLDETGQPFVTDEEILKKYDKLPAYIKSNRVLPAGDALAKTVAVVNKRLATVQILKDKAIVGSVEVEGVERESMFDRLRQSRIANLALGASMDSHLENLGASADEFARNKEKTE